MSKLATFLAFNIFSASLCHAATITVNWDGSADYTTIQAGVNAAVDGDEVVVADGTYTGDGNYNIYFSMKSIILRSSGGAQNCIIDCGGYGGFYLFGFEDKITTVEGFTITGCSEYAAVNITLSGHLKDCIIIDNDTRESLYNFTPVTCLDPSAGKGFITIENCSFISNISTYGGAIYCETSDTLIKNCQFTDNVSIRSGGAIAAYLFADVTIIGCNFNDNRAVYHGGAVATIANDAGINIRLIECSFTGNSAGENGLGGAVVVGDYTAEIAKCTFNYNTASYGGAVYCATITEIEDCHILLEGQHR